MPEDRRGRWPEDGVDRAAAKAKAVEATRRASERAEHLAISEMLAWARRSRRRASSRELLQQHLAGLS
jgi:hypothetical protein